MFRYGRPLENCSARLLITYTYRIYIVRLLPPLHKCPILTLNQHIHVFINERSPHHRHIFVHMHMHLVHLQFQEQG
jgi:hypothetical protein